MFIPANYATRHVICRIKDGEDETFGIRQIHTIYILRDERESEEEGKNE